MNRLQKKWSVRSIAATLACSMLISALPVNALAETLQNLRQESISTEPEILYEIEFMREKNAKVFYRSDGINVAMMTPQALHYRDDNGEWQDIDNTLVEQEDGSLTNTDAGYDTVLPETLAEDPVTIEKDGHELQFTLLNLDKKAKAKENTKEKKEKKVKREKKKDTVEGMVETENLESTVEYIDAATDTDITFDVQPEAVKESIILKKKPKKNAKYTYFVKADGMTAVLKDDRSIEFTPNGEKEAEFILPAPYMFDSSDVERYSTDIEVSLEKAEGGYTITYTPDQNWLRNKETTYPVTIDPTVEIEVRTGIRRATYVLDQSMETVKNGTYYGFDGEGGCEIHTAGLYTINNFSVSNDYVVSKALFNIDYTKEAETTIADSVPMKIAELYDKNGKMVDWQAGQTISYDCFHWDDPIDIDTLKKGADSSGTLTFDITESFRKLTDEAIISLAVRADVSTIVNKVLRINCQPYMTVEFVPVTGINTNFESHTFPVNDAGTLYLNDLTGAVSLEREDMNFGGVNAPVDLKMLYVLNPKNTEDVVEGAAYSAHQWTTNYNMRLEYEYITTEGIWRYYFFDENGQKIAIENTGEKDEKKYVNEEAGYKLDFSNATSLTNLENIRVGKGDLIYYLDAYGRVCEIHTAGKATTSHVSITFRNTDLSGMNISRITDGSGRYYNFVYKSDGTLSDIYFKRPDGTVISRIGYIFRKVNAGIGTQYLLDKVNYYGNSSEIQKSVRYYYTTAKSHEGNQYLLNEIYDSKSYSLYLTYSSGLVPRCTKITEYAGDVDGRHTGSSISITYQTLKTTLKDSAGNTVHEFFDAYGNCIRKADQYGNTITSVYDTQNSDPNKRNNLLGSSQVSPTVQNILSNQDAQFEETYNWNIYCSNGGNVKHSTSKDKAHSGTGAMQMELWGTNAVAQAKLRFTPSRKGYYTATVYGNTEQTATLHIGVEKAYSTSIAQSIRYTSKGTWTQMKLTFYIETPNVEYDLYVTGVGNGRAYVDDAQICYGNATVSTNMIQSKDADFTNGMDKWGETPETPTDSVKVVKGTSIGTLDSNMLELTGKYANVVSARSVFDIPVQAGESYTISAWAKTVGGTPARSWLIPYSNDKKVDRTFSMIVKDFNTNKELGRYEFNAGYGDWQKGSVCVSPEKDTKLQILFTYNYQYGKAYFDGLEMYNDAFYVAPGEEESSDAEDTSTDEGTKTEVLSDGTVRETVEPNIQAGSITETNPYGATLRQATTNGQVSLESTYEYDPLNNYVMEEVDPNGAVTQYTLDYYSGQIENVKDPNGNYTGYTYDALGQLLKATTDGSKVEYEYEPFNRGNLVHIKYNGTDFILVYNAFGDLKKVKIDDYITLVEYTYLNNQTRLISQIRFANGDTINYGYNNKLQLTSVKYGDTLKFSYEYDDLGQLMSKTDHIRGEKSVVYGTQTAVYKLDNLLDPIRVYGYNEDGYQETVNGKTYQTMTVDANGSTNGVSFRAPSGTSQSQTTTDEFGRRTSRSSYNSSQQIIQQNYAYQNRTDNRTTERVQMVSTFYGNTQSVEYYTYDSNGNIRTVSRDGEIVRKYTYDAKNQLIREDNKDLNQSIFITYDNAGNITEKYWYYKCSFEEGEEAFAGSQKQSLPYNYTNKTYIGNVQWWNDVLATVGGHPITYDQNGNPLRYRNSQYVFTWDAGRQLATAQHGGRNMSYTYDENGLRTSKTVDGVTTTYTWNADGQLTSQTDGTNTFYFFYDGDTISAFEYNGAMYYYVRNLQDDVVAIVDSSKNVVAQYVYDAWGNVQVQNANGQELTDANHLGNLNPIRYRGYYYDPELEMYYLQSRYYDPFVSRFINADAAEMLTLAYGNAIGGNLFAYGFNNPISNVDRSGFGPEAALQFVNQVSASAIFASFAASLYTSFAATITKITLYVTGILLPKVAAFFWWQPWLVAGIVVAATAIIITAVTIAYNQSIESASGDLTNIARKHGLLKCKEAAMEMSKLLDKLKLPHKIVCLYFPNAYHGYVCSKRLGGSKAISENGHHYGVLFMGNVYCNIYPEGVPLEIWRYNFYDITGQPGILL